MSKIQWHLASHVCFECTQSAIAYGIVGPIEPQIPCWHGKQRLKWPMFNFATLLGRRDEFKLGSEPPHQLISLPNPYKFEAWFCRPVLGLNNIFLIGQNKLKAGRYWPRLIALKLLDEEQTSYFSHKNCIALIFLCLFSCCKSNFVLPILPLLPTIKWLIEKWTPLSSLQKMDSKAQEKGNSLCAKGSLKCNQKLIRSKEFKK